MMREHEEKLREREVKNAYYTFLEGDMAAVLMYEAVCPICGKTFRHSGSSWTYRRNPSNGHVVYMCSWTCVRAYDAKDGRKAKKNG